MLNENTDTSVISLRILSIKNVPTIAAMPIPSAVPAATVAWSFTSPDVAVTSSR